MACSISEGWLVRLSTSKATIQALLRDLGYRAAFLRKGRWRLIEDVAHATGRNIFWFNPKIHKHREKAGLVGIIFNSGL